MNHNSKSQVIFWAKTTEDDQPGISVPEHLLNVGCVAQCLAETSPGSLKRFGLSASLAGALAALHDVGKISPGFQRKCHAWLTANGLNEIARNSCWETSTESNHAKVTHAAIESSLTQIGVPRKTAALIGTFLGAHHGKIQGRPTRPFLVDGATEARSGIQWEDERHKTVLEIIKAFSVDLAGLLITDNSPGLWWLAGLTTVADWVGSDKNHFPPEGGTEDSMRRQLAQKTVSQIGFGLPEIVPGIEFAELFGFPAGSMPNDLQLKAREMIKGPGVYVIEAPMGIGKTEAALWVAYELLTTQKASGIYFALPTQATSDRIHLRMGKFVDRIAPNKSVDNRLIHGNSWLKDAQARMSLAASGSVPTEDARVGNRWFASSKQALLAPFGVGTVDQALLGVVAAKHFFVRHFALAGKVVILDEVHSYDMYTGTLIDRLVEVLRGLGCTVIILSATLTGKRRAQLVSLTEDDGADPKALAYPLISGLPENQSAQSVVAEAPAAKQVDVLFQGSEVALTRAKSLASHGGVALWICNTVGAAQDQYRRLIEESDGAFLIGLLHSRFPFWQREVLEKEWMSRLDKTGSTRCGCILVSTQIVEQSVDLDADLLVTELAPTDMLLQRMGRLWRHERPERRGKPTMIVLEENETLDNLRTMKAKQIVESLGGKAFVYFPYVLLRTLEVWKRHNQVLIPGEIRSRIESTYEERADDPTSWQELFEQMKGKTCAYRQMAWQSSNIWTVALEDEEGVQTRLNEMPTVQVVLCSSIESDLVTFLNGERVTLSEGRFDIAAAQAIHRNLVKVPRYRFARVVPHEAFEPYLRGEFTVGLVTAGEISVKGLQPGVQLHWSENEGVSIVKDSTRSQE